MGKKTPQISLTEQLQFLEDMERTVPMNPPDDEPAETDEKSAADKEFERLAKKLGRAVQKTSAHFEQRNSPAGAQLIPVLDSSYTAQVITDQNGVPRGLIGLEAELIAGYVRGAEALLPDLHSLAIGFSTEPTLQGELEGWIPISAGEFLAWASDEEINDGTLEADVVQPLLDWLKQLRAEHPLAA